MIVNADNKVVSCRFPHGIKFGDFTRHGDVMKAMLYRIICGKTRNMTDYVATGYEVTPYCTKEFDKIKIVPRYCISTPSSSRE